MMKKYETVFIIDTEVGEDNVKALVTKFKNLIEASATVDTIDEWGKRRLAYPINKKNDGYYVLANYSAVPSFPAELERVFKITEGVLKYLIIRKD